MLFRKFCTILLASLATSGTLASAKAATAGAPAFTLPIAATSSLTSCRGMWPQNWAPLDAMMASMRLSSAVVVPLTISAKIGRAMSATTALPPGAAMRMPRKVARTLSMTLTMMWRSFWKKPAMLSKFFDSSYATITSETFFSVRRESVVRDCVMFLRPALSFLTNSGSRRKLRTLTTTSASPGSDRSARTLATESWLLFWKEVFILWRMPST
mmetsp:Transcript_28545/g.90996  ORF Transcript_28545/g.90996 Transcript_28545/m.90996 type:complete len:213 (-) Transcript_28545:355-993(-)